MIKFIDLDMGEPYQKFNDCYNFAKRELKKNVLAVSSNQSKKIPSYEDALEKYKNTLNQFADNKIIRPNYWEGYSIKPYYFEFWKGYPNRLNMRNAYILENNSWQELILEP